ncbi:MAG: hypothetical protein WCB94_06325 [Terriglobales bacterium]
MEFASILYSHSVSLPEIVILSEAKDLLSPARKAKQVLRCAQDDKTIALQTGRHIPQGLKPACLLALGGTGEAVPFPQTIYETSSKT